MIKTNNQKEYLFMKGINLKYNKYYTANKGLHTKEAILGAYRLKLMIIEYDTLIKVESKLTDLN